MTIKEFVIEFKSKIDSTGFNRIKKVTKDLKKGLDKVGKTISKVANGFKRFLSIAGISAAAVGAFTKTIQLFADKTVNIEYLAKSLGIARNKLIAFGNALKINAGGSGINEIAEIIKALNEALLAFIINPGGSNLPIFLSSIGTSLKEFQDLMRSDKIDAAFIILEKIIKAEKNLGKEGIAKTHLYEYVESFTSIKPTRLLEISKELKNIKREALNLEKTGRFGFSSKEIKENIAFLKEYRRLVLTFKSSLTKMVLKNKDMIFEFMKILTKHIPGAFKTINQALKFISALVKDLMIFFSGGKEGAFYNAIFKPIREGIISGFKYIIGRDGKKKMDKKDLIEAEEERDINFDSFKKVVDIRNLKDDLKKISIIKTQNKNNFLNKTGNITLNSSINISSNENPSNIADEVNAKFSKGFSIELTKVLKEAYQNSAGAANSRRGII